MESRAKILGHPIHPILVAFPLGLLTTAVVFDILYRMSGNPTLATAALWMIGAGVIGGFLAAPFGYIDWRAIPQGTRAKAIGLLHGTGNSIVLLMFIASWWLRLDDPLRPGLWAYLLSFGGAALVLVTGWLGGELVDRLGVGVDDEAGLNASNSITHKPAR
jgi:uncharacterized membrane protein